ncbi:MAG: hypothetical protein R3Y09_06690 [Clostridia bacterium]
MFIEKLMKECSNYFPIWKKFETFTIKDGVILTDMTLPLNSYILINMSTFNDGVYKVTSSDGTMTSLDATMTDETFRGYIVQLAPNRMFLELSDKLEQYEKDNPVSALTSESIPNYSYSIATVDGKQGWQYMFKSELNKFKKLPKTISEIICEVKDADQKCSSK